jgi:hypothetical protein
LTLPRGHRTRFRAALGRVMAALSF